MILHNLSIHGALITADAAPVRGAIVEIRRGSQLIIGRVIWRNEGYFGVRTQDRIDISAILNRPRSPGPPVAKSDAATANPDRRSESRSSANDRLAGEVQRSRRISAAMQFALVAVFGMFIAGYAAILVHELLSTTLATVSDALGERPVSNEHALAEQGSVPWPAI